MTVFIGQKLGQELGVELGRNLTPDTPIVSFRDATFTNASPRMLDYPAGGFQSIREFAGGTLATRRIGNHTFAQVEESKTNTSPQSENLNGAWWTKFNLNSITPHAVLEPRFHVTGEFQANKLIENTATSVHSVYITTTPDGSSQYVHSCYFKADTRSQVVLTLADAGFPANAWAWFNLSTGATSKGAGADSSGTISCGNGWYRCWFTSTSDAAASGSHSIMLHNGVDTTYAGNGTSGLYAWGHQLEIGERPSSLIQTGYNSFTYSEQFDNAAWTKCADATISANSTASPIDTLTADKLTEDVTVGDSTYTVSRSYTPDGFSNYALSVYAKAAGRNHVYLSIATAGFATAPTVYFNLSTGAVGTSSGSPVSTYIADVGNDWYRCAIVALSDAAAATDITIGVATADNDPDYEGDGSSGVYLWGAQISAGLYSGPYLQTVASPRSGSVTRAADQLYIASADVPPKLRRAFTFQWIPSYSNTVSSTRALWDFDLSGASHRVSIRYHSGNDWIEVYNVTTATSLVNSSALTFSRGTRMRVTVDPAAGSVEVRGATTGDGKATGTAWETTEGNVWVGAYKTVTSHANSLISEPY